ncbi:MAG: formate dehydrogenase accessory sulfurtransferase FdhD [Acidimicrobiia bacterium]|nr:formate dehydrogenase accessory sulfurtransferase FdhD [Actinomycetota bacterium]NDC92015.1 formate dehydrogenase accessory sulfurtransferase FdhD [Acidimicrobiia bacterium]
MANIAAAVRRKVANWTVTSVRKDGSLATKPDVLVTEEPLEIRAESPQQEAQSIAVTMRTPGHDFELAVGFLFTEGMIKRADDVRTVRYCQLPDSAEQQFNVVTVSLTVPFDEALSRRGMVTSASCGICGTTSIEQLAQITSRIDLATGPVMTAQMLTQLPDIIRKAQPTFDRTGGLHAAGLVDASGQTYCVREDIGRHNAVDKVIGNAVLDSKLPISNHALVVSGRLSFEIIQKAAMAGIAFIAAVGAPSNLAVETAEDLGITLVGFVRDGTANIYTHKHRITN